MGANVRSEEYNNEYAKLDATVDKVHWHITGTKLSNLSVQAKVD